MSFQIYSLVGTVNDLKERSYNDGEKLRMEVIDLQYRVKNIENYCCPDKIVDN
jgi:hypothetical protein